VGYDAWLAARVRRILGSRTDVEERAMFGGLTFMVRGHMCCGVAQSRLMVRVDPDTYDRLLAEPHARPMDFTGRPMRGLIFVELTGTATSSALGRWVARAVRHAESQTPKTQGPRRAAAGRRGSRTTRTSRGATKRRRRKTEKRFRVLR